MKSAAFFRRCSPLLAVMVLWAVFVPQAQAQQGLPQGTVNALLNDPRYCAYGFNNRCLPPNSSNDGTDANLWHIAMAFSPSTGRWSANRTSYSRRGTSRSEKAQQRSNNEILALYQCSQEGEIRDCTLVFSEEMGFVTAVQGVLPDGRHQLFAAGPGDDSLNRLQRVLGFSLDRFRRDQRKLHQVLLDGCRQVAQECHVVMKGWAGQSTPLDLIRPADAYGAVFIDEADNNKIFAAASHATPQQAEASALGLCQAGGGQQCSRWYGFANMCTAVAVGQAHGEPVHVGVEGRNRENVALLALGQCNRRGASQCRVLLASCSMECDPGQMGCELPRPQKN